MWSFVSEAQKSFLKYYERVVFNEIYFSTIKKVCQDSESLKTSHASYDITRKEEHDAAITYLTALNRLSVSLNNEKIFDFEENDRVAVAGFIHDLCEEYWQNGRSK